MGALKDGGTGVEKALAALRPDMEVQRRAVHKCSNLLSHAPARLRGEVLNDCKDAIYAATKPEIEERRKAFAANGASNAASSPTAWKKPANGSSPSRAPRQPAEIDPNLEPRRAIARRGQAADQDPGRAALR
jgi:hypothetical protein